MIRGFTTSERALIIIGIMAGRSCEEINEFLISDQLKMKGSIDMELKQRNYELLKEVYCEMLREVGGQVERSGEVLWEHCIRKENLHSERKKTPIEIVHEVCFLAINASRGSYND